MTTLSLPQAVHRFEERLHRSQLTTLQLNLGKLCNLACHHCHVEAGPKRTELMTWETMTHILNWIDRHQGEHAIATVDVTGGAPEMNPDFRRFVAELTNRGLHVLDRCNLTILLEPGYEDLAAFLAQHHVEVVASLPCYLEDNVDKQRGKGVYHDSIEALQKLNALGYGRDDALRLDLVYNPVGYGLPGDQAALERDYKRELLARYGIVFHRLFTITNMPIKRFEHALRRDGMYETYMGKLLAAHNPANAANVMCRSLVSVSYDGRVYDCDFNQMLEMEVDPGRLFWDFTPAELIDRPILTASHCFGCTAGAGSSCTGSLA